MSHGGGAVALADGAHQRLALCASHQRRVVAEIRRALEAQLQKFRPRAHVLQNVVVDAQGSLVHRHVWVADIVCPVSPCKIVIFLVPDFIAQIGVQNHQSSISPVTPGM